MVYLFVDRVVAINMIVRINNKIKRKKRFTAPRTKDAEDFPRTKGAEDKKTHPSERHGRAGMAQRKSRELKKYSDADLLLLTSY